MPFVPRGLESQKNPLKHRFNYAFGLSAFTATMNSAWVPLVKNYKGVVNPNTIEVNPHNTDVNLETGAICSPMSIIQNMQVVINATKSNTQDTNDPIKFSWTPFFCAFAEKYDAADDDTGTTVAAIMQLTKDSVQQDITPISTNKLPVIGSSDKSHPLSTVNLAEVATTHLNMTTDATMEDTPWDSEAFSKLLSYGTNKGALSSCLGRTRRATLPIAATKQKSWFLKKFVPRNIRRIVPYTFFGLLFHVPIQGDISAYYNDTDLTASLNHIGFTVSVRYDEWNESHNNTMIAGG